VHALFVCFLAVASAQTYFALRVQDGQAIAIGNAGTHAYLKLVPYNKTDYTQFWYLESAGSVGPGYFVVNRAFPTLNFDINGGSIAAGSRLTGWERKVGTTATRNQRFVYDAPTGFLTPASNANLFVTATSAGIVQLAAKTAGSVGLTATYDLPFYARLGFSQGACDIRTTTNYEYYILDYCFKYNSSHYLLGKLDATSSNTIDFGFFTGPDCTSSSRVASWNFLLAGACNTDNLFHPGRQLTGARSIGLSLVPPAGTTSVAYFLGTCSHLAMTNPVMVSYYLPSRCNPESAWWNPNPSSALSFTSTCDSSTATKSSFTSNTCTGTAVDGQFTVGTCHSDPVHDGWVAKIGCGAVVIPTSPTL
jgi:hypothetical protein